MAPAEVEPSPHPIAAVKSVTVRVGSLTVKLATAPVKTPPSLALIGMPIAEKGMATTVTVSLPEIEPSWKAPQAASASTSLTRTKSPPTFWSRTWNWCTPWSAGVNV